MRSTDSAGKKLRKDEQDAGIHFLRGVSDELIDAQVMKNRLTRQKPGWGTAYTEWKRLREKTRRRPAWHAFYGGPTSIEGLAEHLGHFSMYEIVYRDLSNRMHGGDLYGGVCVEDGHLSILGLLRTEDIKDWASVAATFGLSSIRLMVMHCRPEEITDGSFLRWYEADVKKWNAILDECAADGAMPEGHL
jgi:hypothetical protein